ncbi:hypothetical protein RRG08_002519 [Elysia crispata]|uniref:Fibrinogen C-terminal domain-containing protein n=1 Tax=Elysia crispata TaxID=231223 RepID=A0AAE1A8D0_9GAST|nr:hypothetical protein RRG08_002519 [Elysia crispata]
MIHSLIIFVIVHRNLYYVNQREFSSPGLSLKLVREPPPIKHEIRKQCCVLTCEECTDVSVSSKSDKGQAASGVLFHSIANMSVFKTEPTSFLQRRTDGNVSFDQDWDMYRGGFGKLDEDFWLGNEAAHILTDAQPYELREEIRSDGMDYFAFYETFKLENESGRHQVYHILTSFNIGNHVSGFSYHGCSKTSLICGDEWQDITARKRKFYKESQHAGVDSLNGPIQKCQSFYIKYSNFM